jgi:hypothetical protein
MKYVPVTNNFSIKLVSFCPNEMEQNLRQTHLVRRRGYCWDGDERADTNRATFWH